MKPSPNNCWKRMRTDEAYTIPFGEANLTREGNDVTIVSFSAMVYKANEAADSLSEGGVSVEVVDAHSISFPLSSASRPVVNRNRRHIKLIYRKETTHGSIHHVLGI